MFRMFTACWIYAILANAPFITLSLCLSPPPPRKIPTIPVMLLWMKFKKSHISKNVLFYFCSITESWALGLWNPGSCRCLFQHRWQSGPAGLMRAWTVTMECRPFLSGCSRRMMTSSFEYIPGQNFKPFRSACITILLFIFIFILYI